MVTQSYESCHLVNILTLSGCRCPHHAVSHYLSFVIPTLVLSSSSGLKMRGLSFILGSSVHWGGFGTFLRSFRVLDIYSLCSNVHTCLHTHYYALVLVIVHS